MGYNMKKPTDRVWREKHCKFNSHTHFGKASQNVLNILIHDRRVKKARAAHGCVFINARLPFGVLLFCMITMQYKFMPKQVQTQAHFCQVCLSSGCCIHADFTSAETVKTISVWVLSESLRDEQYLTEQKTYQCKVNIKTGDEKSCLHENFALCGCGFRSADKCPKDVPLNQQSKPSQAISVCRVKSNTTFSSLYTAQSPSET